ncbi:MAG TPA: tRNA (adenosine(37)-N6)-threonylcarbamoyltransferase complex dimerization subunit type 1 TsaB [Bacteroidia bacterium]|nr:tRNA (adenosine(37)-N6)-threonylcarbamoyltransferase complex dimerization subunit type 1 TsaB [Bacteroidia bacterium]
MILLIESATSICSVALSSAEKIIALRELPGPSRHAEKLTVFIEEVMREAQLEFSGLDAVAVSMGPGSYTGLRIGVSAAKGICYAVQKPLIAVGTLEAMAWGMKREAAAGDLLCPMIDARRMEVYCAVYATDLSEVEAVKPVILDANSFDALLKTRTIRFSGDGSFKAKPLLAHHSNARFTEAGMPSARNMAIPASKKLKEKNFVDLAYFEPFYLKTYHPGPQGTNSG